MEVALSPVVLAETRRHAEEAGAQTVSDVRGSLRNVTRKHGVPTASAEEAIDTILRKVHRAASEALTPLTGHAACNVLEWPRVDSEQLVQRELDRKLPTQLRDKQSTGLRDTVIWHGLLEMMQGLNEQDRVLFVTADRGFLDGDFLAPSLAEELEDEGVDVSQLQVVTRLENALTAVEERRALLTRQEGAVQQAVIDYMAAFDGRTWATVDVSREAPARYGVEEGVVVAVDSITIESTFGSPPTTIEATAEITISGWMRSEEYVQDYSDVVDLMDGEIWDPMVLVDYTSSIVLEAEVEVSEDGEEVMIVEETLRWID